MSVTESLSRFTKLGTLRNPILLGTFLGGIALLAFGKREDQPLKGILMIGGMISILAGPPIWAWAYYRLPNNSKQVAFLDSLDEMMIYDKIMRNRPTPDPFPKSKRPRSND